MAQKEVYDQTPAIALAFYKQTYKKEKGGKDRATVGNQRMPLLERGEEGSIFEGEGNAAVHEVGVAAAQGVGVAAAQGVGVAAAQGVGVAAAQGVGIAAAGAAAADPTGDDPASQIAARLRSIGDEINQTIAKDFQEKFAEELRKHTLFTLACDEFKHVCTVALASVQSKVTSGWHQVCLLYNGYAYTANEVEAEAGEAGQDRVQSLGSYLSETMRTTALVEWITDHGGWGNLGSEVTGDDQVVQINVPQNGTSVD